MQPDISIQKRYTQTIDEIVKEILGGKTIVGKGYIERIFKERVVPGTSEIMEGCLQEKITAAERDMAENPSEMGRIKAERLLRIFKTISEVLQELQQQWRSIIKVNDLLRKIIEEVPEERLKILFEEIDRNRENPFTTEEINKFIRELETQGTNDDLDPAQLVSIANGLRFGLRDLEQLEPHLMRWIYEPNRSVGFLNTTSDDYSPWATWAQYISGGILQLLFTALSRRQPFPTIDTPAQWAELAIALQGLQLNVVRWFEQQPYNLEIGRLAAFRILITFAIIWTELANTANESNSRAAFTIALQNLRAASRRPDFPLYGGIFMSFNGRTLHDTIEYFDRPLKAIDGTQEKGRILTIMGCSQLILGSADRAIEFHKEALDIATAAGDKYCQIANLNHLSRLAADRKSYAEAVSYGQKALILARESGDRLGEANALTNYGHSEVLAAISRNEREPEVYSRAIEYLQQGLDLALKTDDLQSQSLCYQSLASANLALQNWDKT
jgi:tetratricopeptide (TPR) repeat protein